MLLLLLLLLLDDTEMILMSCSGLEIRERSRVEAGPHVHMIQAAVAVVVVVVAVVAAHELHVAADGGSGGGIDKLDRIIMQQLVMDKMIRRLRQCHIQ
jgi:hypothetical protein